MDTTEPIVLDDLKIGDAGWIIARHAEIYAAEEGYDITFEGLVAGILSDFLRTRDPARERAFIARRGQDRLGCVFCVRQSDEVAKLRLFLVEPAARGTGLGHRLLEACMDFARRAGYRHMVLWTHESHRAACALYRRSGWRMVSSAPAHDFGQDVIDQHWEIDL